MGSYPITAAELNDKYLAHNGDCPEADNFYPFTAFDDSGAVGHLIMRFLDPQKTAVRFGFVVVDASKRGNGYGKQLISLALGYAFDILGASTVTIGVFENNPAAYACYKSVGFRDVGEETYHLGGEAWICKELAMSVEEA